jgi:predicted Zn finger-like uncharacterized protein
MLTQCPNCQTIFRVTAEILRVAEGQVRCGRCQRQFDALARLIEENEEEDAVATANDAAPKAPENFEVDEPTTHEDITMEGRHIEISGTYRVPDRYGNGTHVQQETSEEWVEIDDADVDADEHSDDISSQELELNEFARESLLDQDSSEPAAEVVPEYQSEFRSTTQTIPVRSTGSPRFAQRQAQRESEAAAADQELLTLSRPERAESGSRIWRFLAVPLALLLIAQWVHSYRATLARHPTIGAPLQATYQALGIPLTPNWDLHAYQIRQWGVISDPSSPGTLRVRATVTNLADIAQPYPLLKLVLEDRWGEQIRAREFDAAEYLGPTIAPNRLLDPGQQADATIAIVDPGPDAEGFRFDVCLPGRAATICAEDVRRR